MTIKICVDVSKKKKNHVQFLKLHSNEYEHQLLEREFGLSQLITGVRDQILVNITTLSIHPFSTPNNLKRPNSTYIVFKTLRVTTYGTST